MLSEGGLPFDDHRVAALVRIMPDSNTPPWKRKNPQAKTRTKLTPSSVAWAKARARKAGRRYPNLVDNMAATRRQLEAAHKKSGESSHP